MPLHKFAGICSTSLPKVNEVKNWQSSNRLLETVQFFAFQTTEVKLRQP